MHAPAAVVAYSQRIALMVDGCAVHTHRGGIMLTSRFTSSICAAVALCALTPSPLCAQSAAPTEASKSAAQTATDSAIDPKAQAIYDKSVAAVKAAKSMQMTSHASFGEAMDASSPPELKGAHRITVRFVEGAPAKAAGGMPPFPADSIRLETLDGPNAGAVVVLHGGKMLQLDAAKKTYNDGGAQPAIAAMMSTQAFPEWATEFRELGKARPSGAKFSEPRSMKFVGTITIDDLECDVIEVVREVALSSFAVAEGGQKDGEAAEMGEPPAPPEGMKVTLFQTMAIARADGLPRQFATKPVFGDGTAGETGDSAPCLTVTVTALTVDPKIEDSAFALTAPEGFRKVEFDMSSMMVTGGGPGGGPGGEMPSAPQLSFGVGEPALDFALTNLDGKEISLASLKGKVVLLDFWATWCPPCKAAMPAMQKLHDDYAAAKKDVVILGVNTWERTPDAAKQYIAKQKFTYGCLLNGDDLATKYGIRGIPTLIIIGKDGTIAAIEIGMSDSSGSSLRKVIDAALAK
jgi:thiol-disulfide isomerase/thioredoxin